ncbi:unnamed protein product, partial [marine sediment metagenome]
MPEEKAIKKPEKKEFDDDCIYRNVRGITHE